MDKLVLDFEDVWQILPCFDVLGAFDDVGQDDNCTWYICKCLSPQLD